VLLRESFALSKNILYGLCFVYIPLLLVLALIIIETNLKPVLLPNTSITSRSRNKIRIIVLSRVALLLHFFSFHHCRESVRLIQTLERQSSLAPLHRCVKLPLTVLRQDARVDCTFVQDEKLIFDETASRAAITKCSLRAISCQSVAEHVTPAFQRDAAAWDMEGERLQMMKRLPTANLARAEVRCARDSINQGSSATNL
jgi:hypothetical protein